eukprot:8641679-Alexandrium_andersonii.AAC.1
MTTLNNSLPKAETVLPLHMEGVAASAGPQGNTTLSRARSRQESATASHAALCAGGAARRA